MHKTLIISLIARVLLAPSFVFAQLSQEEQAFVQKCRDNVNAEKRQFYAAAAQACVARLTDGQGALLKKLKSQSPGAGAAADILALNNSLIDLKNIVTKDTAWYMAPHLARVLDEQSACPLCVMGLGPAPEKLFGWIEKEAASSLSEVKRSVRTWESLGEIRTRSLSSADHKFDMRRWNAQLIPVRYSSLAAWAAIETDKLAAKYADKSRWARLKNGKPDPRLISALREDLTAGGDMSHRVKLEILAAEFGMSTAVTRKKSESELSAAFGSVERLKGGSVADQAAYLSGTFDRAVMSAGGILPDEPGAAEPKKKPFVFKALSPRQLAVLSGRLAVSDAKGNLKGALAEELRGTKAGEEILAFYKDPRYAKTGTNRFSFALAKLSPRILGGWDWDLKKMVLNSQHVNAWMAKNQVLPEQLLKGNPSGNKYMQKLAQYLAPTFVHEAVHQRQAAKAAVAGTNYQLIDGVRTMPYQMEMETEAFSMEAGFVAEHFQKRGAAYADNLLAGDAESIRTFLENGVDGVRLSNHRLYTQLESLEGSAAEELTDAVSMAKELGALEARYKAAPKTLSGGELARMRKLRASIDVRLKWYASVHADSAAAEAKLNGWRREINSEIYFSK